jgi:catechol 2,3-dioxygenase-like lactoylglutathione lyase family enzyme
LERQSFRFIGVELYVSDLRRARDFYSGVIGLPVEEDQRDHHVRLSPEGGFVCLERRGVESYPSIEKAVVFLEIADLRAAVQSVGTERFTRIELSVTPPWAVLPDPDGHSVLLVQGAGRGAPQEESTAGSRDREIP